MDPAVMNEQSTHLYSEKLVFFFKDQDRSLLHVKALNKMSSKCFLFCG